MAVPPAATKKTPEGAEAFARFYFESVGDSYVSGNTALIEKMADDSCEGCEGFVRAINDRASKGQRTDKSSIQVKLAQATSGKAPNLIVEVAGQEVPVRVLDAKGNVVETSKPGVFTAVTSVTWREGGWHVMKFVAI
ncbi:hypothetical protein GCM10009867_08310 [Pedococcus aerophilus]|uniref:DUF6318 domain-containing protein n=1 Tax=Pedococcus aerophilus TaxID=436356 RepID=A0ABP6GYD2_9MICO